MGNRQAAAAYPNRQGVDQICDVIKPFAQRPAMVSENLDLLCPGGHGRGR
jgi:hypothetical protein